MATVDVTSANKTINFGPIGFAQTSGFHGVREGRFVWRLNGEHAKTLARGTATIGAGAYTAVLLDLRQGVTLDLYRDRFGRPGTSLIRVIHAAPELGSPMLDFDSHLVADSLAFTQATPYLTVAPGVHSLKAMRPSDKIPVLTVNGVRLASGVAYSEIVVGSRGKPVQVVTVTDRGAPLTQLAPAAGTHPSGRAAPSRSVTVHAGDSLWKIASRRLGPGASNPAIWREVVRIWNRNAARIGTGDPNLIFPGQRLQLPPD